MRGLTVFLMFFFLWPVLAFGHGDISKLPSSVQVLQYRMALYMNKDDLATRNKLAIAYFCSGRLDEAEKELRLVLEKDQNNFDALDGMGLVLFRRGDMPGALEFFSRAAEVNESDCLVHVHRALVYQRMSRHEASEREMALARSLAGGKEDSQKIDREIRILEKTAAPGGV
jgi:Flp pilus assembly protein TadD